MSTNNASTTSDTNDLVSSLNTLLTELRIPITLVTPADLIPSLFIAILECIIESRLPISPDVRESLDHPAKVQAMKVFLGVLENDVLGMDVGLSEVDPRRLAFGDWDEVVFVGELLCWLGKTRSILPPETVETLRDVEDSSIIPRFRSRLHNRTQSPSTRSTVTNSANTEFSIHSNNTNITSITTVMTGSLPSEDVSFASPTSSSFPQQPRCIHEVEAPSFMVSDGDPGDQDLGQYSQPESYCNCSNEEFPLQRPNGPVRYTGWIDNVDDSLELESFERSKHSAGLGYSLRSTQLDTVRFFLDISGFELTLNRDRGRSILARRVQSEWWRNIVRHLNTGSCCSTNEQGFSPSWRSWKRVVDRHNSPIWIERKIIIHMTRSNFIVRNVVIIFPARS